MIIYSVLVNNVFHCTIQASSRTEAVLKAQVYKTQGTDSSMQRIHVQKPDVLVSL